MGKTLTVSALPNITFYIGDYSEEAGEAIENRNYGHYIPELGYLSRTIDYSSYWSGKRVETIFTESTTHYNNVGDIINSALSYMNKFKDNQVEINVNKNIIEFNFDFEKDLFSEFNNTYIIPSSNLYSLLINSNEMTFNKQQYYKGKKEVNDVIYAHKNFPYNDFGTVFVVDDENDSTNKITYDFSNEYVNYNYEATSYEVSYIAYNYDENGDIIEGSDHIEYRTEYSYYINNVDFLKPRFEVFFKDNSENLINSLPDSNTDNIAYSISELDTILNLTLNTYSLGKKNVLAYFNFTSKYNDWYNKTIQFTTSEKITSEDIVKITPDNENYFNITIGNNKIFGQDILTDEQITFELNNETEYEIQDNEVYDILNPENIKEIDLSNISNKITGIDLLHNYNKKININDSINSSWIIETDNINLESLNIGNNDESKIIDIKGITSFTNLKTLDITNCKYLSKEFSLHKLTNLKNFLAEGSNRKTFIPADGQSFENINLPNTYLHTLILRNNTIDNFNYTPNANLVNLTFENTSIDKDKDDQDFSLQKFVNKWIDSLKDTDIQIKDETKKVLYSGLINNTILTNINFNDYPVDSMIDLSYIGLNLDKLSGTINIIGNSSSLLTREEYMELRNIYGDDLMHIGKTNEDVETDKFKLKYNISKNQFIKSCSITTLKKNDELFDNNNNSEDFNAFNNNECKINITFTKNDRLNEYYSGHSLFDYIKKCIENGNNELKFNTHDIENIGLQLTLEDTNIIPDLDKEKLIYNDPQNGEIFNGDIILYKGNTIILVLNKNKNMIYNYIKLGSLSFDSISTMPSINILQYNDIKEVTLTFNN